ncbi:MAG TPA: hypothetical protein VIK77_01965 [Tissierellaceae bacterium]
MSFTMQSEDDIERTISVIKSSIMKRGTLPEDLVESIKADLSGLRPELVSYFLDELSRECRGAVKYFTCGE